MDKSWDFTLLDKVGVLGLALDREGRIVDWNSSCERTMGYSFAEARGRYLWELLLVPEERDAAKQLFVELRDGQTSARNQTLCVTRDGDPRWIEWSYTTVAGAEGRAEHGIGIGMDVTERRRADRERQELIQRTTEARLRADEEQEAARRSSLLLAAIVENIPDMIFVKDAATLAFRRFNRAGEELLGFTRGELVGKTDHDFLPRGASRRSSTRRTTQILTVGRDRRHPRGADPTQTRAIGSSTPEDPDPRRRTATPLYLLGISEDITERNRAERERLLLVEQLQQAVQARQDLLAIVSHDLRNPLSTILMSTGLLAQTALPAETALRVRDAAHRIHRAAEFMNHLIENLLHAAAIEAGQFPLSLQPQEVAPLVNDALELMRPVALDRGVQIEQRLVGPLPGIHCDRESIIQVFSNLIGNAIKFSPEGAAITVSAERDGDTIRFSVADRGPGIPPRRSRISSSATGRFAGRARAAPGSGSSSSRGSWKPTGERCGPSRARTGAAPSSSPCPPSPDRRYSSAGRNTRKIVPPSGGASISIQPS